MLLIAFKRFIHRMQALNMRSACSFRRCPHHRRCRPMRAAQQQTESTQQTYSWGGGMSRHLNLDQAIDQACDQALSASSQPNVAAPQLALAFVSSAYADQYDKVVPLLRAKVPSLMHIAGCTGYGVVGMHEGGQPLEVDTVPVVSITLAGLPGVDLRCTHISLASLPDGDAPPAEWAALLGLKKEQQQQQQLQQQQQGEQTEQEQDQQGMGSTSFVLLADPSFLKIQELLQGLDYAFPNAPKIGGLASAGEMNPKRGQWCWSMLEPADSIDQSQEADVFHQTGVTVVSLSGPLHMDLMVAQGCRPLSSFTWHIDKVSPGTNQILALRKEGPDGQLADEAVEPLEALRDEIRGAVLSEVELTVLLSDLSVGLAPETLTEAGAEQQPLAPHDFLIRPLALDPSGVIAVGDFVRAGQRMRFMVRDKSSSEQDLVDHGLALKKRQLQSSLEGSSIDPPIATLLFSCVGRGSNLHGKDSFDARTVSEFVPCPTAGFLCNGEIGKVGDSTHLHTFTAAVGIFRARKGLPLPHAASMPADKIIS